MCDTGRVAAGAIAEKYLKLAYGIEIVAFVSSVGRIHMPSLVPASPSETEETDEVEDALSAEFLDILRTVSRETVDAHPTRCPHPETAEKMTQVCESCLLKYSYYFSVLFEFYCSGKRKKILT